MLYTLLYPCLKNTLECSTQRKEVNLFANIAGGVLNEKENEGMLSVLCKNTYSFHRDNLFEDYDCCYREEFSVSEGRSLVQAEHSGSKQIGTKETCCFA